MSRRMQSKPAPLITHRALAELRLNEWGKKIDIVTILKDSRVSIQCTPLIRFTLLMRTDLLKMFYRINRILTLNLKIPLKLDRLQNININEH